MNATFFKLFDNFNRIYIILFFKIRSSKICTFSIFFTIRCFICYDINKFSTVFDNSTLFLGFDLLPGEIIKFYLGSYALFKGLL